MSLVFRSLGVQQSEQVQDSSLSVLLHLPPGVFLFGIVNLIFPLGCSKCAFPSVLRYR